MLGLIRFFILALFIYVLLGNTSVLAHGVGGGEDKTIDNFIIDFGYNELAPLSNKPLMLTFELSDKLTNEYYEFNSAQIKVINNKNELLFRGQAYPDIPGRVTMVYAFPEDGLYTIDLSFVEDKKALVETSFTLQVGSPKKGFLSSITSFFIKIFKNNDDTDLKNPDISFNLSSGNLKEHILQGMKTCIKKNNNSCYFNLAADLSSAYKTEDIIDALAPLEDVREVFARCHELTHYIARNDYKDTKSISDSYSTCTSVCWGGCYHGVMEQYFDEKDIPLYTSDTSKISREIVNACGKQEDHKISREYFECLHGIGHAMMFITNEDLPYSLSLCDNLKENQDREACYGGAFMESSSSSTSHPSRFIKDDDPMYPCNILDEKYLETCYMYQSSHFAKISNYDWVKVGELCELVSEPYQEGCFTIIGSNQVGSYMDTEKFIETCSSFEETDNRNSCNRGVLFGLAGRYKAEPQRMKKFCDLMADKDKPECFKIIGAMTRQWTNNPSDYEFFCESLEQYSTECLTGIHSRETKPPIIIKNV